MSSLKEVIDLQKKQHFRYRDMKQNILNKVTDKICHLARHGELRCIYNVPVSIFGEPKYDVSDVTAYIFYVLKKQGFCVIILNKDKLFISWDINDINNINKETEPKKQIFDIKPLLNIKK